MSIVPVEVTKGVNGLDKVVLREVRGSSAEVGAFAKEEVNFIHESKTGLEKHGLDSTRARLQDLLKRHGDLKEELSRDSDKTIYERLDSEFAAAQVAQTEEIYLEGEEWNDGLLATIRERVHMETERKSSGLDMGLPDQHHDKITYRVGNKVICCLEGARFGIQYATYFAGDFCEHYHCVIQTKSFLEKMIVSEHTVPFFLPLREAEADLLSSNAKKFIDYVGELVQAYVDRREQVRLIEELYGEQIGEMYHSLSFHIIEFNLDDFDCKVMVSLRYPDLLCTLPTRIKVLAWPLHPTKKKFMNKKTMDLLDNGRPLAQLAPIRLTYAEDAFENMSLPEAYAEMVLSLPQALRENFDHLRGASSPYSSSSS